MGYFSSRIYVTDSRRVSASTYFGKRGVTIAMQTSVTIHNCSHWYRSATIHNCSHLDLRYNMRMIWQHNRIRRSYRNNRNKKEDKNTRMGRRKLQLLATSTVSSNTWTIEWSIQYGCANPESSEIDPMCKIKGEGVRAKTVCTYHYDTAIKIYWISSDMYKVN